MRLLTLLAILVAGCSREGSSSVFSESEAETHTRLSATDEETDPDDTAIGGGEVVSRGEAVVGELACVLSVERAGSVTFLTLVFRNQSAHPAPIASRLVEESRNKSCFAVRRNGEHVRYRGIYVCSFEDESKPQRTTLLRPGEERRQRINLSRYFDLSQPGAYAVSYFFAPLRDSDLEAVSVDFSIP